MVQKRGQKTPKNAKNRKTWGVPHEIRFLDFFPVENSAQDFRWGLRKTGFLSEFWGVGKKGGF